MWRATIYDMATKKTTKKKAKINKGKKTSSFKPVNLGGRPPKFETPEQMQKAIENYFASCWEPVKEPVSKSNGRPVKRDSKGRPEAPSTSIRWEPVYDEDGNPVMRQVRPYTISGLAIALDTTRDLLCDYGNKDRFSDIVKRAKAYIHNYTEEGFITGRINPIAGQFTLKNGFGWADKSEVQHDATDNLAAIIAAAHGNKRSGEET